jgi:capsular polysaccharide biosynthesis protein
VNDIVINVALIGRLIRRRWHTLLALAVLGAMLGAAASFVLSPGFVSTSKVLLQGSRDEKQLPAETQVATSLTVLDHVADDLKWGVTGAQLQGQVAAVVDGNVIAISGAADTPQRAQELADRATAQYIAFSTQIVTDAANVSADSAQQGRLVIQNQIDDANQRITELQTSPAITSPGPEGESARNELQGRQQFITKASKDLEQIDDAIERAALDASLGASSSTIIERATLPNAPASPTVLECILGGAGFLTLIGVLAHVVALRTDRRLRKADDVASAVGAPVLGLVEAAGLSPAARSIVHEMLHDDRRWAFVSPVVAEDTQSREARYLRIVQRLESGSDQSRLVVVTAADDEIARGALVNLAVAAAGRAPVVIVSEDEELAERAIAEAAALHPESRLSIEPADTDMESAMTFVDARVAVERPIVADARPTDRAVLLVSMGGRTGWELAAIAGACVDAGHQLVGAVLLATVSTVRADHEGGAGARRASAGEALVVSDGQTLAGAS